MDRRQELLKSFKGEDDLGVVVRSHIIIEQYLNEIIESVMVKPKYFRKEKLDFKTKVKLAISIGLEPCFEKILTTLGTIKNDFSHNLRSELKKQDVNNLYQNLSPKDKELVQKIFKYFKDSVAELKKSQFSSLSPKDKFILIIITIAGIVDADCEQLPNKKINKDT